jgi:hypothetical protein
MLDMKPMPKMNKQPVAGAYGMRLPDTYHILIGTSTYAKCLHHPPIHCWQQSPSASLAATLPLDAFPVWQASYKKSFAT